MEEIQQNQPPKQAPDGVLGFVLSLVGLLIFPLLCIVSFIIAKKDKAQAAEIGVEPSGLTKAASIISIIGIVIIVFWVLIVVAVLIPLVVSQENSVGLISF